MKLFEFPRNLGTFEDAEVTVAIGRFGPYIKHKGKFVSIPKDMAPAAITLAEAQELIVGKRESESKNLLKTFAEEPEMQILNGPYGPYISYNKTNYKIPRTVESPADLTIEQCREIIKEQDAKPKKPARRAARKK